MVLEIQVMSYPEKILTYQSSQVSSLQQKLELSGRLHCGCWMH